MQRTSLLRIGVFAAGFALLSALVFPAKIPFSLVSQSVVAADKSASGKVSAVANDGFSLDVKSGSASTTIQLVINSKTKVTGSVAVGATVNVEYQTDSNGRNIATVVVVQAGG